VKAAGGLLLLQNVPRIDLIELIGDVTGDTRQKFIVVPLSHSESDCRWGTLANM